MTQQIKIPLLPLPPVEERSGIYLVVSKDGDINEAEFRSGHYGLYWYDRDSCLLGGDAEMQGILPKFEVVDGHLVFEVEE